MRKRAPVEQRIFFPWERGGGILRRLGLHRMRPFLIAMLVFAFVVLIGLRERRKSGIRQTRATLLDVRDALDAYLSDHEGECPESLDALSAYGRFRSVPRDAWGRPLRLICPGRREGLPYEVFSDGPDQKPGGLDRIE